MGTVVSFSLREDTTTDNARAALARAGDVLFGADEVFSTWKADSPMSRLRRNEIEVDEAPPEVADVLQLCGQARAASGGWFDPWRMPGGVDPTGLVKGWAAQRALDEIMAAGVPAAMINAGGDIAVFDEPEAGSPWRIGVRHPKAADRLLCVVELAGRGAVATSGTYERGEHVLDPRTGEPVRELVAATVAGPDLALADALSTGLLASGGRALARIASLRGYSALVVDRMGGVRVTGNFPAAFPKAA
jgi:thiamine biosynthesis lipoprotein